MHMSKPWLFIVQITWALTFVLLSMPALATAEKTFKGVRAKVVVRNNQIAVYQAIRGLRQSDPSDVRVISTSDNEDVLEERFDGLPIIGQARCIYKEKYAPPKRIDYQMLESDHFKAFEGSWVLKPMADGNSTEVELSSYIDAGLPIPFARQITNIQTMKDVRERLEQVKRSAESSQQLVGSFRKATNASQ